MEKPFNAVFGLNKNVLKDGVIVLKLKHPATDFTMINKSYIYQANDSALTEVN